MRQPRCICIVESGRCRRPAARVRMGDLFICTKHSLFTGAIIEDWLPASSRSMLAYSTWRTADEAQRLIDRMYRRTAA